MKRITTSLALALGFFAVESLAHAGSLHLENDLKKEWAQEAHAEWVHQYNQRKKERAYAASVSDEMLTYVLPDSWRVAKRRACHETDLKLDASVGSGTDPLSDWINQHLTVSEDAAKVFGFDLEMEEYDLPNEIHKQHAARTMKEVLRPVYHAYNRAKHEEALRVLSISEAYLGKTAGGIHFCREFISSN